MQDNTYINATKDKLCAALAMHRAKEYQIIADAIKTQDPRLTASQDMSDSLTVRITDADGVVSVCIKGYDLPGTTRFSLLVDDFDKETADRILKAAEVLSEDEIILAGIEYVMQRQDLNSVKRLLPKLKPFMTLVEKDRQAVKDARHAKWRNTYEHCIRLFGDIARG